MSNKKMDFQLAFRFLDKKKEEEEKKTIHVQERIYNGVSYYIAHFVLNLLQNF